MYCRLSDQMYTSEEVADIVDSLQDLMIVELESELINATHTNILLLQQMFEQAEKWHLKLQVDVSQLENKYVSRHFYYFSSPPSYVCIKYLSINFFPRELLDKIKEFEEQELTDQSDFKNPPSPVKTKLEPISQSEGPFGLLHAVNI